MFLTIPDESYGQCKKRRGQEPFHSRNPQQKNRLPIRLIPMSSNLVNYLCVIVSEDSELKMKTVSAGVVCGFILRYAVRLSGHVT